jgi:hypothetical protein
MAESFPCIVCGRKLDRVMDDYEGQPDDGVMCTTEGNYGSTVFDPMDYTVLAFNICDPCLVEAGNKGRVFTYRSWARVVIPHMGVVGRTQCDRPYIPWHKDLAEDNVDVFIDIDELSAYVRSGKVQLHTGMTIEGVRESYEIYEQRAMSNNEARKGIDNG